MDMEADQLKESLGEFSQNEETPRNPQIIYSWEAPFRAYKRKSAGVLRFYAAIAVLLSLLVIFLNEPIIVIPIWAVVFLSYVLTITPPHMVSHNISRFGIQTGGMTFHWDDLYHFYFIKKFEYHILVITMRDPYDRPLHLVLPNDEVKKQVFQEVSKHIVYEDQPEMTFTDKLAGWLTTLMPEEVNQADASKHEEKPLSPQTSEPTV